MQVHRIRLALKQLSPKRKNADWCRKRSYGLTRERYDAMVKASLGRCPLCDRTQAELVVDHNHNTKVVRGLICDPCNRALMYFEHHGYQLEWFQRVTRYIKGRMALVRGHRNGSKDGRLDKYRALPIQIDGPWVIETFRPITTPKDSVSR